MSVNNFFKYYFITFAAAAVIFVGQHQFVSCQIAYANAEIGQILVRSTHSTAVTNATTPLPPTQTTTTSSFFSGIRNIFLRTTTVATTTTTTTTPAPHPTTTTTTVRAQTVRAAIAPARIQPTTSTTRNGGRIAPVQSIPSVSTTTQRSNLNAAINNQQSSVLHAMPAPHGEQVAHGNPNNQQQHGSRIPTHQPGATASPGHLNIEISKRGDFNSRIPVLINSRPQHNNHDNHNSLGPHGNHNNRQQQNIPHSPPIATPPISPSPSLTSISSQTSLSGRNNVPQGQQNTQGAPRLPQATTQEIEELTELLFKKSSPNLFPYITVNLQGKTRSSLQTDDAPLPLLSLNESILDATPTLTKLRLLYNNYEIDTSVNEHVTAMERKEENDFLNAVLATPVMRAAMKFLQDKGVVTADPKSHFDLLKTIWFTLYSRGRGKVGSSAFEHVFLSEIKNHTAVSGLHNWVYYYHKEGQTGTDHSIDYKGYLQNLVLGDKAQIVKYRFAFNNLSKPVNAIWIGTLPEFEMALYTVCFEVKANKECPVSVAGKKFVIRTHTFKYRGKRLIGSAFPEI